MMALMKIAVYPGSFDPITLGHVDIIERISLLFDQVVVLISESSQKASLFTAEERKTLVEKALAHKKNVKVDIHSGLTVDYVKQGGTQVIVRGLRAVGDFEYEMTMAHMNRQLDASVETMIIFANPKYQYISSRGVKEVAKHQGRLQGLVPEMVIPALEKKMKGQK